MAAPKAKVRQSGLALKVLECGWSTLPDGTFVISLKDQKGDPEQNGFGKTLKDAVVDLWGRGYETVASHRVDGRKRVWVTRRLHANKLARKSGLAIKQLFYTAETDDHNKVTVTLCDEKGDVEYQVFGLVFDDVVRELLDMGYEFILRNEQNGEHMVRYTLYVRTP